MTPMNEGTKATLNFAGMPGYYNYMSYYEGYGGFNFFADFLYMNATTWTDPNGPGYQEGWCDTGYQNVATKSDASSVGFIYQFGIMESASHHATFTLNSMVAAASFSKNAVWDVISYTEKNGSLTQKAFDTLKVSYTARHVKFDTLGGPDDFKNIAAVYFQLASYGKPGNPCTYGYPVIGAQLVMGDVKVTWSKKAALTSGGELPMLHLMQHQVHGIAHATAQRPGASAGDSGGDASGFHHYHQDSAGHDPGTGTQFHLPPVEHFF